MSPEFWYWWHGTWAVVCGSLAVLDVLGGRWGWAAVQSAAAVFSAWSWWKDRRNRRRRRALALLGAKSRAVRDAMVARVRESGRPRPVLRPVPQGAR